MNGQDAKLANPNQTREGFHVVQNALKFMRSHLLKYEICKIQNCIVPKAFCNHLPVTMHKSSFCSDLAQFPPQPLKYL